MQTNLRRTLISLSVSMLVAACGGGGGGSSNPGTAPDSTTQPGGNNTGGSNQGTTPIPTTTAAMTMSCPDTADTGTTAQCSGTDVVITADKGNGVLVTNSGVQVYGISTSDLQKPIAHPENATGFALPTGGQGQAEMRLFKDATTFAISKPSLLLSNLGIKWDGKTESPQIIETFQTTQGHVTLDSTKKIVNETLRPSSDTGWFDFLSKGVNATQANYANNRYFPRNDPSRCPTGVTSCPTVETTGIKTTAGDWRNGGTEPDVSSGTRLHEDGDVHAGDGVTGSTGTGVPFPGSKGYRDFFNMSYHYANLSKWVSQDTSEIAEWAGTANEHNMNRRGVVAFGDVTDPTKMPATGTATYKGWVRGWYTPNASTDPTPFLAEATISVDFATRQVTMRFDNARTDDAAGTALAPMQFSTTVGIGAANTNTASYLTGTMTSGALKGGVGGRFFGPVNGTPPEIGASFSLSDAASGAAAIGGFIAVKRP